MRTQLSAPIALAIGLCLLATAGCSDGRIETSAASNQEQIVLSVPADPSSPNHSSNSWAHLTGRISQVLARKKITARIAHSFTEKSLHAQAGHLHDLAVSVSRNSPAEEGAAKGRSVFLAVAPYVLDEGSALFSPLVNGQTTAMPECPTGTANAGSTDGSDEAEGLSDEQAAVRQAALKATGDESCAQIRSDTATFVSALKKLRAEGATVVSLASTYASARADLLIRTADARTIGRRAATALVKKIKLKEATEENPRGILILLPTTSSLLKAATSTATDGSGPAQSSQQSDAASAIPAVDRAYLRGVLDVLSPYFDEGKAYNAYDIALTDPNSSGWSKLVVPVDATSADSTIQSIFDHCRQQLLDAHGISADDAASHESPLGQDRPLGWLSHVVLGTGDAVPLSGVLAGDDALSQLVSNELDERQYSGTAADINPQITLNGILHTIGGSPDLSRDRVPAPAVSGSLPSGMQKTPWPVVLGFGGSAKSAALVASGKQWATGIVDETVLASSLATAIANRAERRTLARSLSASSVRLSGVDAEPKNQKKAGTITATRPAIVLTDESTLKATLVDPGYVSAADAGI